MRVDLSRSLRSFIDGAVDRASRLQRAHQLSAAAEAWDEAAEHAQRYAEAATTDSERHRRVNSAEEFRNLATRLRESLRQQQSAVNGRNRPVHSNATGRHVTEQVDVDNEYRESAARLVHRSDVTFDEIAGLESTKRSIQDAFALSLAQAPSGVELLPVRNILFYGPAGCGKTLLSAATSNGLDATFYSVKVGDLMSKYFGESSKLIQALYDEARSNAPAVVFLDEVDALFGDRDSSDSGAERKVLVSFLTELDGLNDKRSDRHVMTIAATNTPWLLDPATLSRFERKVYIPLPDTAARQQIMERQLSGRGYQLELPFSELAARTDGMSGRELERLAKVLIETMIADTNPDLPDIATRGREEIARWQVRVRPIGRRDVETALAHVRPETTPEIIQRFERWAAR